jgi:hypothetical protein
MQLAVTRPHPWGGQVGEPVLHVEIQLPASAACAGGLSEYRVLLTVSLSRYGLQPCLRGTRSSEPVDVQLCVTEVIVVLAGPGCAVIVMLAEGPSVGVAFLLPLGVHTMPTAALPDLGGLYSHTASCRLGRSAA